MKFLPWRPKYDLKTHVIYSLDDLSILSNIKNVLFSHLIWSWLQLLLSKREKMPDGLATKCSYWFCWNQVCTICLPLPFYISYIVTLSASQGAPCFFRPGCIGYYSLDGFCCRVSLELFLALEKGIPGSIPPLGRGCMPIHVLLAWMKGALPMFFDVLRESTVWVSRFPNNR